MCLELTVLIYGLESIQRPTIMYLVKQIKDTIIDILLRVQGVTQVVNTKNTIKICVRTDSNKKRGLSTVQLDSLDGQPILPSKAPFCCTDIFPSWLHKNHFLYLTYFLICVILYTWWFLHTLCQNDKVTVLETDTEYIEMNLLGKLTCFKTSLPFAWEAKYFQIFFWRVCFHCVVYHIFLSKGFWMI